MFGIVEFQDEEENEPLRYTPMYAFYNWEQLTPTMFLSQTSLNHTEEHHDVNNDTNTLQVKPRLHPSSTSPFLYRLKMNSMQSYEAVYA